MRQAIDNKHILDLASSLENDELGAAVRLLGRIVSTAKPVRMERAHVVAQVSRGAWEDISSDILEFFTVEDGTISHAALADAQRPAVSAPVRERAGQTNDLPIVNPTRKNVVPNYPERQAPERISIKQAAYETMMELCRAAGQSENTARAMLASLLKTWPEGDVYDAVYQAGRQGFIADPRSWILATLKAKSQPVVRTPRGRDAPVAAPKKQHKLATPDALGVSQSTAERIRARNRALGLKFMPNGAEQ